MKSLMVLGWFVFILLHFTGKSAIAQDSSQVWIKENEIGSPQFFAVLVKDADKSAKWYSSVFHLKELGRLEAENGTWEIINLSNKRLFVEIIRDNRAQEADRSLGLRKVGFYVPDVRTIADRVKKATGERPRVLDFNRFGIRLIQIKDPDGTVIQLSSLLENQE